jgi:hypothetical protein
MLISMVLFLNELFYSSIYPSAHVPGAIQIPISGNNTGSLPDLTNVNFSSPIRVPLDQDLDQGSSPYSSSPVNTSPATLSPTSIPQGVRQGPFHFAPVSHAHSVCRMMLVVLLFFYCMYFCGDFMFAWFL